MGFFYYNEWCLDINLFCFNVIGEFFLYKNIDFESNNVWKDDEICLYRFYLCKIIGVENKICFS